MLIITTPHTEQSLPPQCVQNAEQPAEQKADKNGLGVFARLLAGLTNRNPANGIETGAGEHTDSAEISGTGPVKTAKPDVLNTGQAEKMKNKAGNTGLNALTGINNAAASTAAGANDDEIAELDLSQQGKDLLFTLGVTLDHQSGQTLSETNSRSVETSHTVLNTSESLHLSGETLVANDTRLTSAEPAYGAGSITKKPETAENPTQPRLESQQENADRIKAAVSSERVFDTEKTAPDGEKTQSGRFAAETRTGDLKTGAFQSETVSQTASAARQTETGNTVSAEERKSRLQEVRNREKRQGVTPVVKDFRSQAVQTETAGRESVFRIAAGGETRVSGETAREVTVELHLSGHGREQSSAITSWESNPGRVMENLLARELYQNLNNEIVRHASFLLKDGNEGTIRLNLKPESLGNVKIHLEMAENKIMGRIVVESADALRAFERELSSLEKAFRDSGFDDVSLDMSLAADSRGTENQWREAEASRFLHENFAASRYDNAADRDNPPSVFEFFQNGAQMVNMLA